MLLGKPQLSDYFSLLNSKGADEKECTQIHATYIRDDEGRVEKITIHENYYNKLAEYLKAQGDISIKNPDYPYFTRLRFISITYKSILKINRFTERFTFVSFLIDFDNGASYQKEVYFEYIKITPISIEFGPFYPDDNIELQDVLTRYISESFDLILKSESN